MSLNLHRRHLSTSQKGTVAAEIEPMLAAEAKERQKEAGTRGREGGRGKKKKETLGANSPQGFDGTEPAKRAPKATEQAAKIVGVGSRSVQYAKTLKKNAPELFEAVKAGKMTLNRASAKFRAYLAAEIGERAMELETVDPGQQGRRTDVEETSDQHDPKSESVPPAKPKRLRAILRAPEVIQSLYRDGLVGQAEAALMGPKQPDEAKAVKVVQARQAVEAIRLEGARRAGR